MSEGQLIPSHLSVPAPPQFIVHVDGTDFGPIDAKDLQLWAYEERILPGTMVRIATSHEWKTADSFAIKFPLSNTAQPQAVVVQNVIHNSTPSYGSTQQTNNALAAFLSFLLPGLGQLVQGQQTKGILMLMGYLISIPLMFVIIGLVTAPVIYFWSIIDAAIYQPPRRRYRSGRRRY